MGVGAEWEISIHRLSKILHSVEVLEMGRDNSHHDMNGLNVSDT